MSWKSADSMCKSVATRLVVIINRDMNTFVQGMLSTSQDMSGDDVWMPLNISSPQGDFLQIDGMPYTGYVNWKDSTYPGPQKCAVFSKSSGTWSGEDCELKKASLCEHFPVSLCPKGWVASAASKSCIKPFEASLTWEDAKVQCNSHRGHLVAILEESVQRFVAEQLKSANLSFWIGLNDKHEEGQFTWLDGYERMEYTHWSPQRSENKDTRDCVQINKYASKNDNGWTVHSCEITAAYVCERFSDCENVKYGMGCFWDKDCSEHCKGSYSTCSRRTGICHSGCETGFIGVTCSEGCAEDKYGPSCLEQCNSNCFGPEDSCNSQTGRCTLGCEFGFRGDMCDEECAEFTWGLDCISTCSLHCQGSNKVCNATNGHCPEGCEDGYTGDLCDRECEPYQYGKNCMHKCSSFCGGELRQCNSSNGNCLHPCAHGYQGPKCDVAGSAQMNSTMNYLMVIVLAVIIVSMAISAYYVFSPKPEKESVAAAGDRPHQGAKKKPAAKQQKQQQKPKRKKSKQLKGPPLQAGKTPAGSGSAMVSDTTHGLPASDVGSKSSALLGPPQVGGSMVAANVP